MPATNEHILYNSIYKCEISRMGKLTETESTSEAMRQGEELLPNESGVPVGMMKKF